MSLRQLWKLLFGVTLISTGVLVGVSTPAEASGEASGGCVGDIVFALDVPVWSRSGYDHYRIPFGQPLPPGVWSVQVSSHDAYEGRSGTVQLHEQWQLTPWNHATFGPTTDLADGVEAASVIDNLGTLTNTTEILGVTVSHALPSTPNGTESVNADCVAFTSLGAPGGNVTASATTDCSIPGIAVDVLNNRSDPSQVEVGLDGPSPTEITVWLSPGESVQLDLAAADGDHRLRVAAAGIEIYSASHSVSCDQVPDPDPPVPPDPDPPVVPDPDPPVVPDPDPPVVPTDPQPDPPVVPGVPTQGPVPTPTGPAPAAAARFVPSFTASLECASTSIEVTINNAGALGGVADLVLVRSSVVEAVELGPFSSTTVVIELPDDVEGFTVELLLVASDGRILTAAVPVDCLAPARPAATVSTVCASHSVEVRIVNRGGEPAEIDVFVEQRSLVAEETLAAGAETTISIPIEGSSEVPVRVVTAGGTDLLRETVEVDCPEPVIEATLSVSCPSGEVQLVVRNLGDSTGVARVLIDGGEDHGLTPEPGEEVVLVRRIDIGSSAVVEVIDGHDVVVLREVVEAWVCDSDTGEGSGTGIPCASGQSVDDAWTPVSPDALVQTPCPDLSVRLVIDCVGQAVNVIVSNGSPDTRRLAISVGGIVIGDDLVVAPGGEAEIDLSRAVGERVLVGEQGVDRALVDILANCDTDTGSGAASVAGILVVLASLVTAVFTKFDPWIRI